MATTPRNIRFDNILYDEMKGLAKYPMTTAYHIQEACRQYLKQFDKPVAKPKKVSTTPITGEGLEHGRLFELFWVAGMKKTNKIKAKPIFIKLLVKATPTYEEAFTNQLINDVKKRLASNQLGFDQMHPTTYLNGERWNDEVTPNEQNQPRANSGGYKLSAVERVAAATEKNRAARASNRGDLGNAGGDIWEQPSEPVRRINAGSMDIIAEGDYTETNS